MKFIDDAQLPKSLSDFLNSRGYNSIHTLELPEKNKTKDFKINAISSHEGRIVITKDYDFLESFLLTGQPQKLVLVKTGNIRNAELIKIFDNYIEHICEVLRVNSLIEIIVHL